LGVKNRKELLECIESEAKDVLSESEIKEVENCIKEN
jgi:hypothetical protein